MSHLPSIGLIGGTGAQGRGLAARFAEYGHQVWLGSRDQDRAMLASEGLAASLSRAGRERIAGVSNDQAAARGEVLVVTPPWGPSPDSHAWLRPFTEGEVVVSCINPLGFDRQGPFGLVVDAGSAAEHLAARMPEARVASAFHHVLATRLITSEPARV